MSFDPTSIAGLQLWLKADAGTWQDTGGTTPANADGQLVARWDDQSGNLNQATQATAANQPILKHITQGGKTYWVTNWDAARNLTLLNSIAVGTGNIVVYAVVRRADTSRRAIVSGSASTSFEVATNSTGIQVVNTGNAVILNGTQKLSADGMEVVRAKRVSGTTSARCKGINDGSAADATNYTTPITLVGNDNGGSKFLGDVAEICIYNQDVSAANEALLEAYFVNRYLARRLVVTDGNSITASGPGATGTNTWPSRLPSYWDGLLWGCVNIAVSGQTTANMISDEGTQVAALVDPLHSLNNVLFCWEGSNDIKTGATDVTAYGNLKTYCSNAKGYSPAYDKVVVCTIWPRTDYTGTMETYRQSVNASLRADFNVQTSDAYLFKPANGVTYADALIDLARMPEAQNAANTTYFADGIHGTDVMYYLVASRVATALNALYGVRSSRRNFNRRQLARA